MKEKQSLIYLILIMSFSVLLVGGFTFYHLYQLSIEEQRAWLSNTAKSQARLIESIAEFDEKYSTEYPGGTAAATLRQIIDAHNKYEGFGESGEFSLARLEGDKIVFLLRHRHFDVDSPKPVLLSSNLAQPMKEALAGKSGTLIGLDYRGVTVLAAYEPVAKLNLGIVAKMDIVEIRQPFIKEGIKTGVVAFIFIVTGSILFTFITNPIIEKLKNSERRMKIALEETDQGIWEWDMISGGITFDDNWPRILGYKPGEKQFDIDWWNKNVHPDSQPVFEKALNAYQEGHERFCEFEYQIKTKSGEWLWVWARGVCIEYDETDKPLRMLGVHRDVTKLKNQEKVLKSMKDELLMQSLFSQRLSALGALSGGIAHELNQPLSGIGLYAKTLLNILKEENKIESNYLADTLTRIAAQVGRSKEIIKHMREFSSGERAESIENLNLKGSVVKSLELFHAQLNAHYIDLEIDIPSDLYISANLSRFEQVLVNLVSNARDSLDEKHPNLLEENIHKQIHLKGRKEKNSVLLEIIDNGSGIPLDIKESIFEPFVTSKIKVKGSGLGLAICKKILKDFNAEIELTNTGTEGSTFRVRFPLAAEKISR